MIRLLTGSLNGIQAAPRSGMPLSWRVGSRLLAVIQTMMRHREQSGLSEAIDRAAEERKRVLANQTMSPYDTLGEQEGVPEFISSRGF